MMRRNLRITCHSHYPRQPDLRRDYKKISKLKNRRLSFLVSLTRINCTAAVVIVINLSIANVGRTKSQQRQHVRRAQYHCI